MTLRLRDGSEWKDARAFRVWDGSAWRSACLRMWNGSAWVNVFGDFGEVLPVSGGTFIADLAISVAGSSAGSGYRLTLRPDGHLLVINQRGGSEDPGGISATFINVRNDVIFATTPCAGNASGLAVRAVPISGTGFSLGSDPANDWLAITQNRSWQIFASVPPNGGLREAEGTFRVDFADNADPDKNVLWSATFTFGGSAYSGEPL